MGSSSACPSTTTGTGLGLKFCGRAYPHTVHMPRAMLNRFSPFATRLQCGHTVRSASGSASAASIRAMSAALAQPCTVS